MSRHPSRLVLRAAGILVANAGALLSLGAQGETGIRYEFSITSGRGEASVGSAYVLGGASRIEMPQSDRDFIVLQPGHLYSVHPDKREYSDSPPDALADVIGNALRATRMIVRFDLSDVEVTAQDLGEGGVVAGHPTRHYRLVQRFSVSVRAMIIGGTDEPPEKNEVVTDYWVANDLQLPRNPLVELVTTAPSAIAQQDRAFARRSSAVRDSLFTGMPLKVEVTTRKKGEHAERAESCEVTSVTRAPMSRQLFEIPAGYRRTDEISIHSM